MTTKNDGTKTTTRQAEAIMPLNTAMPIERRAAAPAPVARTKRQDAENEGERGHDDRAEAQPRRFDRGVNDIEAERSLMARIFDDQDAVFAPERDQKNDADLRVEIVIRPFQIEPGDRAEKRQRHGEDHRERQNPAFVLAGEHEIDEEDREAENPVGLVANRFLLKRHCGPVVTSAPGQRLRPDLIHDVERLTRAEAGRRRADDRRCRIEVVEADQRRPRHFSNIDHSADWRHDAVARPHLEIADVVDRGALVRFRLSINLEDVAELVELRHIVRSDIAREG